MTGWQPDGNESGLPVWKPEPAKPEEPKAQPVWPNSLWPYMPVGKVDIPTDAQE